MMFSTLLYFILFCLPSEATPSLRVSHKHDSDNRSGMKEALGRNNKAEHFKTGTVLHPCRTKSIISFVLSGNKCELHSKSGADVINITFEMSDQMGDQKGKLNGSRYEGNSETFCNLKVSRRTVDIFNKQIIHEKANILTLRLKFSISMNVSWSSGVILPFEWRWVFKNTYSYLKMPYASFVWSFGLLYIHSAEPVDIELGLGNVSGRCLNLTIGEKDSDLIIGNALGNMTKLIAMKDSRYNTSQWCYMRKMPQHRSYIPVDIKFFKTKPSLEYICCAYNEDQPRNGVKCSQRQEYKSVWWDIHQTLGILMLLYFPVVFMKLSGKIHRKITMSSAQNDETFDSERKKASIEMSMNSFVYLEENSPVTATSLISSALSNLLPSKQSTKSRLAIFVWSVGTLILPAAELIMWYIYLYDFAIDLAKNGVSFGFSSMLAGWEASRHTKLSLFGGPYVALGLYVVIGWVLMLCPKKIADLIYVEGAGNKENVNSILWLNLSTKENLGSVKIGKNKNGYTRCYKLQLCHLYMLLNSDFWSLEWKIVKTRWYTFVSVLVQTISFKLIRGFITLCCFPIYFLFSLIEIAVSFCYYSVPMLSFLLCVTKGFSLGLNSYVTDNVSTHCSRIGCIIRFLLCAIGLSFQVYYLYIFTILFLDSFNFVSRILIFTYTAIIAYPRETYGYFMLILTTAAFGISQFSSFGDIYKLILKIAIKQCKKDETLGKHLDRQNDLYEDEVCGVSRDLFEYLIAHIRPRRVQMFHNVLRLATMTFVLSISIEIMVKFEKFEELGFFVNIFVTMFICALPTIYYSIVSKGQDKVKLTRKINKLLRAWDLNQDSLS